MKLYTKLKVEVVFLEDFSKAIYLLLGLLPPPPLPMANSVDNPPALPYLTLCATQQAFKYARKSLVFFRKFHFSICLFNLVVCKWLILPKILISLTKWN